MKKVLFICTSSQSIYNFRLPLIRKMESAGYSVETVSFDDKYRDLLMQNDVRNHCIDHDGRTVNPFKIRDLKRKIREQIGILKPDIVCTFMAKPNVYGSLAARQAGVKKLFSMVEGAGDPFIRSGIKWKLVKKAECRLYKKVFRYAAKVFFLNQDDKRVFLDLHLLKKEQAAIINGVGVDLKRFTYKEIDETSNTFIMVARMLTTKGVLDYCECARLVRSKNPCARFLYLGAEGDLRVPDIDSYVKNKDVEYLGNVPDVRPYLEAALMMVLPSYREGKPVSVMEAAAVGRGVIVSDCIGCRDMVVDGFNGFLVKPKDPEEMAGICLEVLNNKTIAKRMGYHSRIIAETVFDQDVINDRILEVLNENCSFA